VTIQAQILTLMLKLKNETRTAVVLITHDLGVVSEVCDRVAIMYAGLIVEEAPVQEIFKEPLHPYTRGLIAAIPGRGRPGEELATIAGSVPDLVQPPDGCRFHPRCPLREPVCQRHTPPLETRGDGRRVACHLK
jgi:peptide/nickel transport system ATP-binding protein